MRFKCIFNHYLSKYRSDLKPHYHKVKYYQPSFRLKGYQDLWLKPDRFLLLGIWWSAVHHCREVYGVSNEDLEE